MQVAQAALAVLDVGFDLVAAFAGGAMTRIAFGHLRIDESAGGAGHDLVAETLLEGGVELRVTVNETRIEQGCAYRDVAGTQLYALVDRARGMPHLEAQVPQHIEDVFGDAFAPRGLLVGKQEQ